MTDYADAVLGWARHLTDGGVTPWSEYAGSAPARSSGSGPLPSAANLELLRRLNQRGGVEADLATTVLTAEAPGRGAVDPGLPHPDAPVVASVGAPADQPEDLPDEELLRVAIGVIAEVVGRRAAPVLPPGPSSRRAVALARRFRVHGPPQAADRLRRSLLAAGWVEGHWRATQFVLGTPIEAAVDDLWRHRIRVGGAVSWPRLWRRLSLEPTLRPRLDPLTLAAGAASGTRPGRVHLCLGDTVEAALVEAARVAGAAVEPESWGPSSPIATALRARVNQVLAIRGLSGGPTQTALDSALEPRTVVEGPTTLRVPRFAEDFARDTGRRLALAVPEEAARAGYAVHGDPASLALLRPTGARGVPVGRLLSAALDALVAADRSIDPHETRSD